MTPQWITDLDDPRVADYRSLKATNQTRDLGHFVVEGEKDADRLRSLGFVATTSAQGAKGWHRTQHDALAGRRV